MDKFQPFQVINFDKLNFKTNYYKEYCEGREISNGYIDAEIICNTCLDGGIKATIVQNTLKDKILDEFEFDSCITLEDRIQLTILPKTTNVVDLLFSTLGQIIQTTREYKNFTSLEPIVGHIFTDKGVIEKFVFKMTQPERLIEFYNL